MSLGALLGSVAFNTVTQGLADVICQRAERRLLGSGPIPEDPPGPQRADARHPEGPTQGHVGASGVAWDRTGRFMIASGVAGGFLNYAVFHGVLPRLLPGRGLPTILAKVAFNNTLAKAASAFVVIGTNALLEGRDRRYIWTKLQVDVQSSVWLALAFWGPSQLWMFRCVPERYHTHVISSLGVVYSAIYSYIVHREVPEPSHAPRRHDSSLVTDWA
eukprot:EG_transcript_17679